MNVSTVTGTNPDVGVEEEDEHRELPEEDPVGDEPSQASADGRAPPRQPPPSAPKTAGSSTSAAMTPTSRYWLT